MRHKTKTIIRKIEFLKHFAGEKYGLTFFLLQLRGKENFLTEI